jgi:hypothetical protein
MSRVVDWDGKNIPAEMRALPPGRYVVERIDEAHILTADEKTGIRQAIASLEEGGGHGFEEVRDRILSSLRR